MTQKSLFSITGSVDVLHTSQTAKDLFFPVSVCNPQCWAVGIELEFDGVANAATATKRPVGI